MRLQGEGPLAHGECPERTLGAHEEEAADALMQCGVRPYGWVFQHHLSKFACDRRGCGNYWITDNKSRPFVLLLRQGHRKIARC